MAEWDDAHFLDKGANLTSLGSYGTLIEQAIEQAQPASPWHGDILYAATTPPTTGDYVWHKRCLWYNTTAQRLYYFNDTAGSWDYIENLLDLVSLIGAGDITLSMLATTGAAARYVLRRNATNTAFEWVTPTAIFNVNEIPPSLLTNATGTGYHLLSDGSGVFQKVLFSDTWATAYTNADKVIQDLEDGSTLGEQNQVLYLADTSVPGTPGQVVLGWADQLLRTNKVTTNKLLFSSGAPGKWVKVNAGGTDFEYADEPTPTSIAVATLVDTGVSGTAALAVPATTATQVRLAAEKTATWCTVAANAFTLTAGTYIIQAAIPIFFSGSTTGKGYVALIEGASTTLKTANVTVQDDDNTIASLYYVVTPGVSTTYKFNVYLNSAGSLGLAGNFGAIPEVYSQVLITRIA